MSNYIRLTISILTLFVFTAACAQKKTTLKVGDKVPAFVLKDQEGKDFDLAKYIGKQKLVIYFYPKDESSVCTKEACAFRDSYTDYVQSGAVVIGINSGSVASHKAFATNHNLPFVLLSDPGNKVLEMFGVKGVLSLTGRETFVIDLSGKIVYKFRSMMSGDEHSDKALEYLAPGKHK